MIFKVFASIIEFAGREYLLIIFYKESELINHETIS